MQQALGLIISNDDWPRVGRRGCKTMGTEEIREEINNLSKGEGGWLLTDSRHYHKEPTDATVAGCLMLAIYTPVSSMQV